MEDPTLPLGQAEVDRGPEGSRRLGAGEPDFDTPDNIKEAAIAAIRQVPLRPPPSEISTQCPTK